MFLPRRSHPGILPFFMLVLGFAAQAQSAKKPYDIQWAASEASKPILLPPHYDVSKYGHGKYRIDGLHASGRMDAIHILFQPSDQLEPASVPGARETPFASSKLKGKWRTYRTTVEGRAVTRREVLLPNLLPRLKKGKEADFIWMRIDATRPEILDELTPLAEGILRDAQ